MLRTWPGQTKEEWLEEYRRDKALTPEESKKEWDEYCANIQKERHERNELKRIEQEERSNKDAEWMYIHAEKPNSLDDGEATVTWIIIMLIGTIFKERWIIWIAATFIYLCRMNRYAIRKWKWANGGKEEYYQKIQDACKGDKNE